MARRPAKRLSVSIPAADARCLDWLKSQSNISASLRFLIHDALSRWGTKDVVYDVMPVAIAAVSARRTFNKRVAEQRRDEVLDAGNSQVEETQVQQRPQSRPAAPVNVPEPVQPAVPEPDDEDYFVDPAQFL